MTLLGGSVFVDPFAGIDEKMARAADPSIAADEEKAAAKAEDSQAWFNSANSENKPTLHRAGIGKYIAPHLMQGAASKGGDSSATAAAAAASVRLLEEAEAAAAAEPPKKKAKGGGFGSFAGW